LDVLEAHIACTDKPFMGSANGRAAAADSVAIAEILFGADAIRHQPALLSLINSNSPRRYDGRMLEALIVYARARQALVITPFISAGVTGPVTIAGSIAQQHAEVLAGIALVQMISPGAPVVYGSFLTTGDMRTGGPVFTAPEFQLALCAGAQLARRCRVPFRGGGMLTGAKLPDAQAAIQSMTAMSATVMAGTHFVLHAAGWLDGGLVAGYEKFVLDCEALGMMHAWHQGLDVSDESLALGDIAEVAPGGHYLETEKTLTCCHNAFHQTPLFENDHFMGWQAAGGADAYKRAAERVRHLLGACPPPRPLSPDIELALRDYIARRDDHPGFAA
jgi:trimethylamine--corrinoid protein Co-methyltransferase